MKKIYLVNNLVFYTEKETNEKRSRIFYKDGIIVDTNYDEGIELCQEYVIENKITSTNALQEAINNGFLHICTEEYLNENYKSFMPTEPFQMPTSTADILSEFDEYVEDGSYGIEEEPMGLEDSDLIGIEEIFSNKDDITYIDISKKRR